MSAVPTRDDVVARYVEFVAGRCRPNTVIATESDLRIFFAVIDKHPVDVTPADVFAFIAAQRRGPDGGQVVRLSDGETRSCGADDQASVGERVGVVQLPRVVR